MSVRLQDVLVEVDDELLVIDEKDCGYATTS